MEKGPDEFPAPSRFPSAQQRLEDELQTQLDSAVAARAENRVERSVVRSRTATTERAGLRRIGGCALAIPTGGAIRISKIGMIENIESFKAELGFHPFAEFEA